MASGRIFKTFLILSLTAFVLFLNLAELQADIISELEKLQKTIETMRAEFVQEKYSELLEKPIISKGSFYFSSPERFVWDYNETMKVASDGKNLIVFYKELKEADIIDVTKFPSLPRSFTIEKLRESYRIEAMKNKGKGHRLKFTPSIKSMPLREINIMLDEKGAPLEVKMIERTGDSTVIKFTNMQTNVKLPEDLFSMKLPKGTKIRRHLSSE